MYKVFIGHFEYPEIIADRPPLQFEPVTSGDLFSSLFLFIGNSIVAAFFALCVRLFFECKFLSKSMQKIAALQADAEKRSA
jgi:hypothetical protein